MMKGETGVDNDRNGVSSRFGAFCLKVLKLSSYKWYEIVKRREEREISLSLIYEESNRDFSDPIDYSLIPGYFNVYGMQVEVRHEALADAISHLDKKKQEVILLYFFLNFKNREIAELSHCAIATVSRRKGRALAQMREELMRDD